MGTYYTPAAPVFTEGYLFKPETKIYVGTANTWGSLDRTGWTYSTYSVAIGLTAARYEIGKVKSLSFTHNPDITEVEGANVQDSSIYDVVGEETTLSVEVMEWNPQTLVLAFPTGEYWHLADEYIIAFGGGCTIRSRPISLEWTNSACGAPSTPAIGTGLSGGVFTLYDCLADQFNWDPWTAAELNTVPIEFKVRPVLTLPKGRRLGSLCLY